ncbi:MAG: hypothetical protein WB502_12970 [Thermoactinomyces sp.]
MEQIQGNPDFKREDAGKWFCRVSVQIPVWYCDGSLKRIRL